MVGESIVLAFGLPKTFAHILNIVDNLVLYVSYSIDTYSKL